MSDPRNSAGFAAATHITLHTNSRESGVETGEAIVQKMTVPPQAVIVYITLNHDQAAFLKGLRGVLGSHVPIVGCSAQGVCGPGVLSEEGYIAGAMAFGGTGLEVAAAGVDAIHTTSRDKGRRLAGRLNASLSTPPKIAVMLYDPLCGVDTEPFLEGLADELGCPVIGGGAGHYFGPMKTTYQYFDDRIASGSAAALALSGAFSCTDAVFSGCEPMGIEMTVTGAEANTVLTLDDRPALEVWKEICSSGPPNSDHTAALALGVPSPDMSSSVPYLLRAAFGIDEKRGGVVLQTAIQAGSRVMLHHRTVESMGKGFEHLEATLSEALSGSALHAVLGFECGALGQPFLGKDETSALNLALQRRLGSPENWLGLVTWGEICTLGGAPTILNYAYPLLAITD